MLPVVGQLHLGAGDLDARAGAGGLLVFGLLQDGFRQRHIGLGGFHVGILLDRGQVGARHRAGYLLTGGLRVAARRRDA